MGKIEVQKWNWSIVWNMNYFYKHKQLVNFCFNSSDTHTNTLLDDKPFIGLAYTVSNFQRLSVISPKGTCSIAWSHGLLFLVERPLPTTSPLFSLMEMSEKMSKVFFFKEISIEHFLYTRQASWLCEKKRARWDLDLKLVECRWNK